MWPVWSATAASTKQNSSIKKSHDLIWFCLQILSSQRNTFRHRRHSAVILNSFVFTNWQHPRCDLQHNFTAKCHHLHSLQGGLPNELRHVFQVGSQQKRSPKSSAHLFCQINIYSSTLPGSLADKNISGLWGVSFIQIILFHS